MGLDDVARQLHFLHLDAAYVALSELFLRIRRALRHALGDRADLLRALAAYAIARRK